MLKLNEAKGMQAEVLDTKTNKTTIYTSIRKAANAMGCAAITLRNAEKVFLEKGVERLIKGRFIVRIKR